MKRYTTGDCRILELPRIYNEKGNITPIRGGSELPFEINRVFYLYDIPGGESRGAHAHKRCHQLLVAASGSFEVEFTDGNRVGTVLLNRPCRGLHIPPGIWAAEKNFSSGSVCLVFTSHKYDEDDYIRDYGEFLRGITTLPLYKIVILNILSGHASMSA